MSKLNITEGEWRDSSISSKIEGETLISVGEKGIMYALYDKFQDDNTKLIIDAGNTYQKCSLLPSVVLAQRDELIKFLELIDKDLEVQETSINLHIWARRIIKEKLRLVKEFYNAQP